VCRHIIICCLYCVAHWCETFYITKKGIRSFISHGCGTNSSKVTILWRDRNVYIVVVIVTTAGGYSAGIQHISVHRLNEVTLVHYYAWCWSARRRCGWITDRWTYCTRLVLYMYYLLTYLSAGLFCNFHDIVWHLFLPRRWCFCVGLCVFLSLVKVLDEVETVQKII